MKIFVKALVLPVLLAACGSATAADSPQDENNFRYQTVTTSEGLTFRVPEDMPIENRGGIQAPIPFDEYMYGKFKQMDQRLQRIETQLQRIEDLLQTSRPSGRLLSSSSQS